MSAAPEPIELQLEKSLWTITDVIGAGGGGEVRAASSTLLRSAAAKFVTIEPGMPRELVFDVGPKNARNVVPVIDQGRTDTHWVIVMPRADRSLDKEILSFDAPMPLARALWILKDIAVTLHDLHGKVVHRDVKPANVLLLDGRWQLTDFGIARYHDARTATQTKKAAFSREYAAPERWREEHATSPTDVYSWGVVAYEILSGHPPFLGPKREDFREQHLHATPTELKGVPTRLAALVEECLYKDEGTRPLSTEILDRLLERGSAESPGIAKMVEFWRDDARIQAEGQARRSVRFSQKQRRQSLHQDAMASFRRLSKMMWEALTRAGGKPDNRFDDDLGWCLVLGPARLALTHSRAAAKSAFASPPGAPPGVAAYAKIDLTIPLSEKGYAGRAHSLWFSDMSHPGSYRWHEIAFLYGGFPDRISTHMPFALDPDQETRQIAGSAPGRYVLSQQPFLLNPSTMPQFIDRWAQWFAEGAQGSLSFG